jgi:nitrogen-specific signal transduction histidine kinase
MTTNLQGMTLEEIEKQTILQTLEKYNNNMSVQSQYDNSHRRSTDQQVKKMILLTQPETLVFQLLHHAVENQHNAVGFLLSDRSQPTAEILLTKKFHTVADDIFIRTSVSPTMLEIADTGAGISKEVETKLFSPFFSTKPNGQGIGLIFIREVLIKHGCTFSLRTYPDKLTRFRIRF